MRTHLLKPKISFFLCIVLILLFTELGYSQDAEIAKYPSRPITFICPIPAGSGGDLACRLITKEAEKFLGQPIVLLNKPGASFTIGAAALASSKPDGYTIGYPSPTAMFVTPFFEKLPYHPVKDFQQIIQFAEATWGLTVKADSPFNSFKDLIAFARQNPKKLNYGTNGAYSIANITMLQIAKKEGAQFNHIPFRGGAEIQAAVLGGHIDFGIGDFAYSLVEGGKIKLLVLLGEKRHIDYTGTPIFEDLGYDFRVAPPPPIYISVGGPKGIPEGIVKKLEEAFTKAIKEPAFINGIKEIRYSIVYHNRKEISGYMAHYYELYEKLIKEMKEMGIGK